MKRKILGVTLASLMIAGTQAFADEGCTTYGTGGYTETVNLNGCPGCNPAIPVTHYFTLYHCGQCMGPAQNTKCKQIVVSPTMHFLTFNPTTNHWEPDANLPAFGICWDYTTESCN
jgi:hypothetical protein